MFGEAAFHGIFRAKLALGGLASVVDAALENAVADFETLVFATGRGAVLARAPLERLARLETALVGLASGLHTVLEDLVRDLTTTRGTGRRVALLLDTTPNRFARASFPSTTS